MNNRDVQKQAYKDYQDALQEAEKKKPEGSWYKIPAEDRSTEGRLIYDPAGDAAELSLPNLEATIPGKYLAGLQAALNSLLGDKET